MTCHYTTGINTIAEDGQIRVHSRGINIRGSSIALLPSTTHNITAEGYALYTDDSHITGLGNSCAASVIGNIMTTHYFLVKLCGGSVFRLVSRKIYLNIRATGHGKCNCLRCNLLGFIVTATQHKPGLNGNSLLSFGRSLNLRVGQYRIHKYMGIALHFYGLTIEHGAATDYGLIDGSALVHGNIGVTLKQGASIIAHVTTHNVIHGTAMDLNVRITHK